MITRSLRYDAVESQVAAARERMSEFPKWVEVRGLMPRTYEDVLALHRKLQVVYELLPDLDEILERASRRPDPRWRWWRRALWYVRNG